MPRAAGNSTHYTWRLWNESTGRYETDCEIKLVSVTTVINAVLAKPQLVGWAYRYTRDAISGAVSELLQATADHPDERVDDVLDLLTDADMLEEYLKENRLRPDDAKYEAATRGTRVHKRLESLAELALVNPEGALAQAQELTTATDPYTRAIANWWVDTFIAGAEVFAPEMKLWSLKHGFQGTTDLLWYDEDGLLHCTDLKTRKAGGEVYDSDLIQGGAYKIAGEESRGLSIDIVDVLIAHDDGSYTHSGPSPYAPDVFLMLLSIYNSLKGVK